MLCFQFAKGRILCFVECQYFANATKIFWKGEAKGAKRKYVALLVKSGCCFNNIVFVPFGEALITNNTG